MPPPAVLLRAWFPTRAICAPCSGRWHLSVAGYPQMQVNAPLPDLRDAVEALFPVASDFMRPTRTALFQQLRKGRFSDGGADARSVVRRDAPQFSPALSAGTLGVVGRFCVAHGLPP